MEPENICAICGSLYPYRANKRECCSKRCLAVKKNMEANERWLKKVPKMKEAGHNMKIARSKTHGKNDYLFRRKKFVEAV